MYEYDIGYGAAVATVAVSGFLVFITLISLAVSIFSIVCVWKVFKKAGKNGWEAIIPVYNLVVLIEIAELPLWYIALFFVPFANVYAIFKIYIELAHKFGKSTGFGIGMVFIPTVFMAILAFSKEANYLGKVQYQQQPQPNYQQQMSQPMYPQQSNYQQQPQNTVNFQQNSENTQVVPRYCTACGSPVLKDSKFCVNCGKQLQ